jgi:hypothetical protein
MNQSSISNIQTGLPTTYSSMDQAQCPPYWIGSGKATLLAIYMTNLLTSARAGTTCKVHAFGGPRWAQPEHFWEGDMTLSPKEIKLIEAYERQGREDLAHCVRNARVHQLLDGFFGHNMYFPWRGKEMLSHLHAMKLTFNPGSSPETMTIQQWLTETEKKYEGDEGLALVKELNQRQLETRSRSRIVYPLQRVMRRSWKRCRKFMRRT